MILPSAHVGIPSSKIDLFLNTDGDLYSTLDLSILLFFRSSFRSGGSSSRCGGSIKIMEFCGIGLEMFEVCDNILPREKDGCSRRGCMEGKGSRRGGNRWIDDGENFAKVGLVEGEGGN